MDGYKIGWMDRWLLDVLLVVWIHIAVIGLGLEMCVAYTDETDFINASEKSMYLQHKD